MSDFNWTHGENEEQEYYDTKVGKDYLCVFRNKFEKIPNIWMAFIDVPGRPHCLYDKTANDQQRKEQGLPKNCSMDMLTKVTVLCNADPKRMMEKVEYCYKNNLDEINGG